MGYHRKSFMRFSNVFFIILFIMIIGSWQRVEGADIPFPFAPGEKLLYKVGWLSIPAGEMRLEVLPMKEIKGEQVYHFVMTTTTYSFVDLFYKLRQRIEAFTNKAVTRSLLYKKETRGKKKRDEEVRFDWEKKVATYEKNGKKEDTVNLLPGAFDPLSIFYVFRLQQLEAGKIIEVPVSDGKKCVMGKATVVRREIIRVGKKRYDTFLVEPDLKHIGGVFKKSKNATLRIWFTADKERIPVKVESKVKVGSFRAELVPASPRP
ncbi:MAG: hypothetical protein B1H13_04050 [Desulfobacteraceae bacterium 4484_190.3]|nr:MAG: hypothetical protein B1H13_04050 [Desulfobacteraceae bacterium 4484_190.3]